MPYGSIVFTLTNGRNLRDKDLFGRNDAYATVQLAAGLSAYPSLVFFYAPPELSSTHPSFSGLNVRGTWRSKTHNGGGKAPIWNEKHNFDIVEGDDRLQIQVFDEDTARDDLIGSVCINLVYVPPPNPSSHHSLSLCMCTLHLAIHCQFIDVWGRLKTPPNLSQQFTSTPWNDSLNYHMRALTPAPGPLSKRACATSGSPSPARAASRQARLLISLLAFPILLSSMNYPLCCRPLHIVAPRII